MPQTLISKSDDIFGTQLGFNNALAIDIDRKLATIKGDDPQPSDQSIYCKEAPIKTQCYFTES